MILTNYKSKPSGYRVTDATADGRTKIKDAFRKMLLNKKEQHDKFSLKEQGD